MNDQEKKYLAVGFDGNMSQLTPIINMNVTTALETRVKGVTGIRQMSLYLVDFVRKVTVNVGNIPWQDAGLTSDVVIRYDPEQQRGTVRILQTNQVWDYQISPSQRVPDENPQVLDRDRVRQLEQEEENQVRILWPDEMATELGQGIFGQEDALKRISEIIAANLRRKKPEVEVIVLFGPTGVGKTETGKALPGVLEKLTGETYGFQQIALSQFVSESNLNQFFGSPPSYVGYKEPTIFEPCRSNPRQIFLLDEAEKGTERFWTGIMECFSNSTVKLADNSPEIDLSHSIFIMTSNVPIDMEAYEKASTFGKKEICRDALTRTCGRPEVAGKITNCLAFRKLPSDAVTDIVLKFVVEELRAYDMELAHMDESLMVELKQMHCKSEYGARSVKDAVRTAMTPITYDRCIDRYKDKKVRLTGTAENIVIEPLC